MVHFPPKFLESPSSETTGRMEKIKGEGCQRVIKVVRQHRNTLSVENFVYFQWWKNYNKMLSYCRENALQGGL